MPAEQTPELPWLTVIQAAARAQVSVSTILRESRPPKSRPGEPKEVPPLRSVRVGGRKSLRFRPDWIDNWLMQQTPEFAEAQQRVGAVRS